MLSMRELVAAADAEFAARGMPLKPGGAQEMLRMRVAEVARQAGISERTARSYFTLDSVREMARATARSLKEDQAAAAQMLPVELTVHEAGLVVSALSVVTRLAVVNSDLDAAAALCDIVTGVAVALRDDARVPAELLRGGVRWIEDAAQRLAVRSWAVSPGGSSPQDDGAVAGQLTRDATTLRSVLDDRAP